LIINNIDNQSKVDIMTTISDIFIEIKNIIESLKIGERISYTPNHELLSEEDEDIKCFDWSVVEEIQMSIRGPILPNGIFATLRFDNQEKYLTIDFYRLS
jgi:hypothetical protein